MNFQNDSDFLLSDQFIKWRLFRTQELDGYWADFISANPQCEDMIASAIEKFNAIRINNSKLSEDNVEKLLQRIIKTSQARIRYRRILRSLATAAVLAAIVTLGGVFTYTLTRDHLLITTETIIGQALPAQDIQLITGSTVITFDQNASINLSNDHAVIRSETSHGEIREIALSETMDNRLLVPKGKLSSMVLPDGSKAWLNSGTELIFPSRFDEDTRTIKVNGEIYIDVKEDKSRPFLVETENFTIKVHGTRFNVSSYAGDPEKTVILEEGSVEIQMDGISESLVPGEMFSMEGGSTQIRKIDDMDMFTCWKDGYLIFNGETISNILDRVGRYYNVDFLQSGSSILLRTCSGKLILSEDITEVMEILCLISGTIYNKSGGTIYINDK